MDLSFGGAKSKVGRLVTTLKNKVLICVLERKMSDLNEDLNARSKFLHLITNKYLISLQTCVVINVYGCLRDELIIIE